MIPKRDKNTDIASEIAQGKLFRSRLTKLVDEVTDQFVKDNSNLNDLIAAVAEREGFSRIQIQRLVEETNTIAYNKRYNQIKKAQDRRFTFELAELDKVLEIMGPNAPEAVDNPNWVKGKAGDGNIEKKASLDIETAPIHNPNAKISEKKERLMQKQAAAEEKRIQKELKRLHSDIEKDIFKVANSLVMTEKLYKQANQVFNTAISDVDVSDDVVGEIQKKAGEISQYLGKTGRALPDFVVSLEVNPTEKVASVFLGEYSLVKEAEQTIKVEVPKVAPTSDISDYEQLVRAIRNIQEKQMAAQTLGQPITKESEVN